MTGCTSVENYKLLPDPPRSGAFRVVKHVINRLQPEQIVYVSCNPATLARDSGMLVRLQRYMLAAASLIDMFPHTAHIEAKALIVR